MQMKSRLHKSTSDMGWLAIQFKVLALSLGRR
jgi:hypothetical protein